ncbi:MAG: hypothetical protein ACLTSO_10635 [Coprococcus sp.]
MSINDYTKTEGVSQLPSDETEKQLFIIEQLHEQMQADYARTGKKKTYHVVTFGCQMNAGDQRNWRAFWNASVIQKQIRRMRILSFYNTCTA